VGLDRNAAKAAFSQYLDDKTFSANQIRFVENIIDRLTQQGVMDPGLLFQPPYTNFSPHGIDGIFEEADADQIIAIVRSFNETVGKAFTAA
jgi:type I restriction enzyme R subunit